MFLSSKEFMFWNTRKIGIHIHTYLPIKAQRELANTLRGVNLDSEWERGHTKTSTYCSSVLVFLEDRSHCHVSRRSVGVNDFYCWHFRNNEARKQGCNPECKEMSASPLDSEKGVSWDHLVLILSSLSYHKWIYKTSVKEWRTSKHPNELVPLTTDF